MSRARGPADVVREWVSRFNQADSGGLAALEAPLPKVTLYTANVCPFCPIVRRRLADLRRMGPFEVEEIDVTFRPEIIRAKRLRSVPVLEANGRLLAGNATSAQIVEFLRSASSASDIRA